MVAGGEGYRFGQASGAGVVHAHQPLKFGEFTDHRRSEVSFCQPRGLLGKGRISPNNRGNFARKGGDPRDAVGQTAEFIVKGHRFQAVKPFRHAGFGDAQIVFPEEFCIRQPSRQHLLIARQDRGAVIRGFGVGHCQKALYPASFRVFHREKLLMFAH